MRTDAFDAPKFDPLLALWLFPCGCRVPAMGQRIVDMAREHRSGRACQPRRVATGQDAVRDGRQLMNEPRWFAVEPPVLTEADVLEHYIRPAVKRA